jgi:hypothetical protein
LILEERILILVPTLFFFITVAWGYLFQKVIYDEIQESDRAHFQKIEKILSPHFHQVTYSDAIFLFMVNGIIWILQLYRLGLGVIVMVTGVVLAVTGLLVSFTWRYERGRNIANWVMLATLIVAAAEFIMFIFIP